MVTNIPNVQRISPKVKEKTWFPGYAEVNFTFFYFSYIVTKYTVSTMLLQHLYKSQTHSLHQAFCCCRYWGKIEFTVACLRLPSKQTTKSIYNDINHNLPENKDDCSCVLYYNITLIAMLKAQVSLQLGKIFRSDNGVSVSIMYSYMYWRL